MRMGDEVLQWLLGPENPPVRWLTLTDLLGRPASDPEARAARDRCADYPVTLTLLGHVGALPLDDERPYWSYAGLYWQLILLGQVFADGRDPRIAAAVDFVLERPHWAQPTRWQCLTANLLGSLIRLGYADHPVVRAKVDALAQRTVERGGIDCREMGYSLLSRCFMALPKLLLCFTAIAPARRSPIVAQAIERIVAELLDKHVFVYVPGRRKEWAGVLAGRPARTALPPGLRVVDWVADRRKAFVADGGLGDRRPKAGWLKFGFPMHYNSDVLEAALALARAGIDRDPRLDRALEVIRSRRTADGRWILDRSMNGKTLVDVERAGAPSKWLTVRALSVLKRFACDDV